MSVCTCSKPTPAGLLTPDHCGAAAWPLVIVRQRLPRLGLSTLNSMAFGLAVYASQCGLLQHHARLASSCWSGSTGRAFHPPGSAERFQSCRLHLIPPSQACLAQTMCHEWIGVSHDMPSIDVDRSKFRASRACEGFAATPSWRPQQLRHLNHIRTALQCARLFG